MSTAYSLSDSTFKDAGGAKMMAWINLATSQLDFLLPAGIGAATVGSKITGALLTGNGLAGSKIEVTGAVGNILMAHFASNASVTALQNGIHLRADDRGAQYISALSSTACAFIATSHDTVTTASGLLYQVMAAGCGVISGACVSVQNGAASLGVLVFSAANENLRPISYQNGTCFGSLVIEKRNTVGPVYVTVEYRGYGQG